MNFTLEEISQETSYEKLRNCLWQIRSSPYLLLKSDQNLKQKFQTHLNTFLDLSLNKIWVRQQWGETLFFLIGDCIDWIFLKTALAKGEKPFDSILQWFHFCFESSISYECKSYLFSLIENFPILKGYFKKVLLASLPKWPSFLFCKQARQYGKQILKWYELKRLPKSSIFSP